MSRNDLLARLLSRRNSPSVLEREALFERISGQVATRPRHARWRWGALAATAAVVVVVVVVVPRVSRRAPEFAARGNRMGSVRALCPSGPCRVGDKLLFEVDALEPSSYLAGLSKRGDGTTIWYFPASATDKTQPAPASGILDVGVTLGAEHAPGSYEITFVVSRSPLTRDEVRQAIAQQSLPVIKQRLDIK